MGTHIVSLIVGIIFGACIILAGLADPDKIIDAFRLKNTYVIRTIILFILVGLVGTWIVEFLGNAEINNNTTATITLTIGGLLVGAGIGLTGYSPCTSLAGAASGRIDAIITILGMFFGAYVYVFIYPPVIEPLEKIYNYGKVTLPEITNISSGIWIISIVAAGVIILFLTWIMNIRKKALPVKNQINTINKISPGDNSLRQISNEDIVYDNVELIDTAKSLGFWKNLVFFVMTLCLLLLQISFWLVNRGYITQDANNEKKILNFPVNITFGHINTILNISNTILILASVLYVLILFFCLSASFCAFRGGLRFISRAFFSALVVLVLLFPWQILLKSTVSGAIYTPGELLRSTFVDTEQTFSAVILYLRFVAYWAFVVIFLIRAHVYSIRWRKSFLKKIKQVT